MVKRRAQRFWSEEEKRRIVAQTLVPDVSVTQVARRYGVDARLVSKWRCDPRFRPAAGEDDTASFLPVEVAPEPASPAGLPRSSEGRIEIALRNGHRVSVSGPFDADALCRLVGGLAG